ncbi:MAG: hypothetical protein LUF33_02030 [Clostridiales bacterium]|nr:hypothetical protein [Clostridiales bacterium]
MLALFINLIIAILFLIIGETYYEIADNQTYSLFIADGDYKIVFTNYFLCLFCGFIQNIIYPLNAFVTVHLFFCFCAFTAITRVFLDKFNTITALCITLFLNGFFAVNHYLTISFTRAPALICVAGFLCIIHYINRSKWKLGTIIGAVFILIGSTYRFKIFEVALVMAVCFVIAKSISQYFSIGKPQRKISNMFKIIFAPKRLIVCIITVAVCFSVYYVSDAINTSTDELSYYKQYTTARSVVWDHTIVDCDSYEEEYDKIGIDENDIAMLRAGYMDDEGAFTLEKLQQIKDIQPNNILETQYIVSTIKEMFETEIGFIIALGDKGMVCLAFVFVLIPFIIVCKKRNCFIPIFLMVVAFCFYLYLWFFWQSPLQSSICFMGFCNYIFILFIFI